MDFSDDGLLCIHLDSSSYSSRHGQKLAAEQLLKGRVVRTKHHSTNHTCRATLLQLIWAERRIEPALYDFRPLWSKYITPHVQLILLYKFSPLNLLSFPLVFGNLSFFISLLWLIFLDIFDQNATSTSVVTFSFLFDLFTLSLYLCLHFLYALSSIPCFSGNLSFFIYLLWLIFLDIFDQNATSTSVVTFSFLCDLFTLSLYFYFHFLYTLSSSLFCNYFSLLPKLYFPFSGILFYSFYSLSYIVLCLFSLFFQLFFSFHFSLLYVNGICSQDVYFILGLKNKKK